jgi:hypothetical protein
VTNAKFLLEIAEFALENPKNAPEIAKSLPANAKNTLELIEFALANAEYRLANAKNALEIADFTLENGKFKGEKTVRHPRIAKIHLGAANNAHSRRARWRQIWKAIVRPASSAAR